MDRPNPANSRSGDTTCLGALRGGDSAETENFLKNISGMVWSACCLFAGEGGDTRKTFSDIFEKLSADKFARLAGYDGRGSLNTFVMLVVRELLSERVLRLLAVDRERSWDAFERLYKSDIQRLVQRRIPAAQDEELRRDVYQDVCLALIENNYHRLKSYKGSGSFGGFILQSVDRILIDLIRKIVPRRRLPAAIATAAPLDQLLFKLVYWKNVPADAHILLDYVQASLAETHDLDAISASLARISAHAPDETRRPKFVPLPSGEDNRMAVANVATPEDALVDGETELTLSVAVTTLQSAIATLPARERHYLSIALNGASPPPSREIARLMQCPVEDIYKLKQNVLKRLRVAISDDAAVKNWRASV